MVATTGPEHQSFDMQQMCSILSAIWKLVAKCSGMAAAGDLCTRACMTHATKALGIVF